MPAKNETDDKNVQVMDLDVLDWEAIKQAASESVWMPPEYMRNEWVSDVCRWLREGEVDAEARIKELEGVLAEWIKPCFCGEHGTCLMCQTRKILSKTP